MEPLFVQNGVDVVFAGHEHFYERLKPQKGIYYFTEGGSAKLRKGNISDRSPMTEKGFDTDNSFMLVEIVKDQMFFETISRKSAGRRLRRDHAPRGQTPATSGSEPCLDLGGTRQRRLHVRQDVLVPDMPVELGLFHQMGRLRQSAAQQQVPARLAAARRLRPGSPASRWRRWPSCCAAGE